MLRGNTKYIIILIISFTSLVMVQYYAPKPIDWTPGFSKKEKKPYGTNALYELLSDLFSDNTISDAFQPPYNILNGKTFQNRNYLFINTVFNPDKLDTRELLKYAEQGNNVFIAANMIKGKLADTLKLKINNEMNVAEMMETDSTAFDRKLRFMNDVISLDFVNPSLKDTAAYTYTIGVEDYFFVSFDTSRTIVLGEDRDKHVNFIKIKFGKGNFYIHSLPQVFGNYCFVDNRNANYVYKVLSCLPPADIIWDEYYKEGKINEASPFRVIFRNPSLMLAYDVLLLSIILFMIFGAKRKQRIIPVLEPLRNTTLEFVRIVGTFYYQRGDHKNLADKKITFFLEHVRSLFQIKTTIFDDEFLTRVANLSGINKTEIKGLFDYIEWITCRKNITEEELLKLNLLIEKFHNKNKR